ncbi:CHASE domain-containing protein [Consotaella aegiceratis]|uniref:CHASE domain-containing protein n=1 Tax=Consotaella aegiceratis TaxID=3097961 RepID=UPI002F42120B
MRKYLVPATILVVSSAFALALAALVWRSSAEGDRLRFEGFADDAVSRIENRLDLHVSLLEATRAYLLVTNGLHDRDGFRAYVAGLDLAHRYGGIQGIGYAEAVLSDDTAEVSEFLRDTYGLAQGVWPPDTDQPARTPIVLLEPQDRRNQAAIGYDMFANAIRREAMVRSVVSGAPSATAPVELVQEIDENRQTGFLIYLPWNVGERPQDETQAILEAGGFVYAPFRVGDLIAAALSSGPSLPLTLKIYDGRVTPEMLMVDTAAAGLSSAEAGAPEFATQRSIDVAGQTWLVEIAPSGGFRQTASDMPAVLLAVLGLALSMLLAVLAFLQARRAEAVAALAEASTQSLAQKDLLLREMNHRIKNSITRVLAIARQTGRNSADLDEFMTSYTARLRAMATSQEMLMRSGRQEATIRDLLHAELAQVFGEDLRNCTLIGPDVEVHRTAVQPLGLTFHELATNALKYGAVLEDDGTLTVDWRREGDHIAFDWIERSARRTIAYDPNRKGFGTRLIDMNIERELGGRIERTFEPMGLVVRVRFPVGRARVDPENAIMTAVEAEA